VLVCGHQDRPQRQQTAEFVYECGMEFLVVHLLHQTVHQVGVVVFEALLHLSQDRFQQEPLQFDFHVFELIVSLDVGTPLLLNHLQNVNHRIRLELSVFPD